MMMHNPFLTRERQMAGLKLVTVFLSVASCLFSMNALAFQGRHSKDPTVSLDQLRSQSGRPIVKKSVRGKLIQVDSSAVLSRVSVEKLLTKSLEFDRYVQMGMPHLRASQIVERSQPESLTYVWSHMVLSAMGLPMSSKHYIRVHQLPTGSE